MKQQQQPPCLTRRELILRLRRIDWRIALLPVLMAAVVYLLRQTGAAFLVDKRIQEIAGPSFLLAAIGVSLFRWALTRHPFFLWCAVLSGALFCREIHFAGTSQGVYVVLAVLFVFLWRRFETLRPCLDHPLALTLLAGVIITYILAVATDQHWYGFIHVIRPHMTPIEETLESFGHFLLILFVTAAPPSNPPTSSC